MKSWMVTIVAGLFFVLAVQAGSTAATTGRSDASTSAALQGKVRIQVKGKFDPNTGVGRGHFTLSGAISDRVRFVDRPNVRTLFGAKGNLWITLGLPGPGPRCGCNWRITKGTKAYAGLRGRGREVGLYASTIDILMSGTVSQ